MTMNKAKWMATSCMATLFALLALGCAGTARKQEPFSAIVGAHPTTWLQDHYVDGVKTPQNCQECHGSTTDPALSGGISKVSCFSCHTTAPRHPADWTDHMQHGRRGAQLAPVATTASQVPVMAGFAHCAKCHGSDFSGGIAVSCKSCHTKAPHPNKPWLGANAGVVSHSYTNPENAATCFTCHAFGANFTGTLKNPAAPTTAPGCYNATMCHAMPVPAP
jgi:hypothetical protein